MLAVTITDDLPFSLTFLGGGRACMYVNFHFHKTKPSFTTDQSFPPKWIQILAAGNE